ncbi:RND family efflux transporter MFP subunit [Aliiruegeria haliotis]|uniref:RND family efflux transporter MFP subunit n=1 Tax=Aliiruegeria haliotis TaxID=1280846 RepID=A0A2T0RM59_9RHOB|nr:efflux RND transporter periplasmic adaptor subunit [Aliiruegeria haliotis]PRY22221.1 RND family efflux transporter MFP subunit [Aliiruegeria haliotis]
MRFCVQIGAVGALVSLAIVEPSAARAQGRPADVQTDVVSVQQMLETSRVFGQVIAERESAVAARVPGIAVEIPVRVGSRVKSGDLLAQLDTELLQIEADRAQTELMIAEAGLQVANARLDRAVKAFARAENLRASANISDATLEDRVSALAEARGLRREAEARIASARNAMTRAQYNFRNASVAAPFDGVVLEVSTEVGQYVSAGSQIATLLDVGQLEVQANVPAELIDALRPEVSVEGETGTGVALGLTLRAILPTEFAATHTRPVLFELSDAIGSVAVGQTVTLNVPVSAPRDVLVVPKDALVQSRDGWSVFVNDDGTAMPRTLEIGEAIGGGFEVLSGLQAGDKVVVRGNERLRPGQSIVPLNGGPQDGVEDQPATTRSPAEAGDPRSTQRGEDEGSLGPASATAPNVSDEAAAVPGTVRGRG